MSEPSRQRRFFKSYLEEHPTFKAVCEFFYEEGNGLRSGWLVFLIMMGACLWVGSEWGRRQREPEIATLKQAVLDAKETATILRLEKSASETQLKESENAIAPWKSLANARFPSEPINERLDLLFHEFGAASTQIKVAAKTVQEIAELQKLTNPKKLSEEARKQILVELQRVPKIPISIKYSMADKHSYALAHQIKDLFNKSGFKVEMGIGLHFIPVDGVRMTVGKLEMPQPLLRALKAIQDDLKLDGKSYFDPELKDTIHFDVGS